MKSIKTWSYSQGAYSLVCESRLNPRLVGTEYDLRKGRGPPHPPGLGGLRRLQGERGSYLKLKGRLMFRLQSWEHNL